MRRKFRSSDEDIYRFAYAQMMLCGIDVYIRLGQSDICVVDDGFNPDDLFK